MRMDFTKFKKHMEHPLLDKYWNAETSREEEEQLQKDLAGSNGSEATYFNLIAEGRHQQSRLTIDDIMANNQKALVSPTGPIIKPLVRWLASAAAILVFVISGLGLWKYSEKVTQPVQMAETFDDPYAAYEEVREALAYVSGKLNKSQSEAMLNIKKASTYSAMIK